MGYNQGMEVNYESELWDKSCPKYDCRKNRCKCGLKYVRVPVSLENEYKPVNGAYCNAIVEYEGSGAVYIYSSEGVPVLVREGDAS